jgi:hypothetical protein
MIGSIKRQLRLYGRHFSLAAISGIAAILISIGSNYLYDSMKTWLVVHDTVCRDTSCFARLADQNGDVMRGLVHGGWMGFLGVLIAAFLAIPMAQRTFNGSAARIWRVGHDRAPAYRALILMPSLVGDGRRLLTKQAIDTLANASDKRAVLAELCASSNEYGKSFWPWQQTLRLIDHNFSKLKVVVCLLSEDVESEFPSFKKLLELAGPSGIHVLRIPGHVSTNDYNLVEDALSDAIAICREHRNIKTKDICVDITSGTRAYCAAAAIATLNNPTVFAYVQTRTIGDSTLPDQANGKVIIYDASLVS